ncbi:MAG: filamentous hemagglutinin N-terminal domain-containing protein, partial [Verrucomicrobiales bacterium]
MSPSYSNPSGGVVTHGGVEIDGLDPAHLKIFQSTDKAIINWQDFSIGQGEITQFFQPGKSSVALNRVVSGNPSAIYGQLKANGGIMLINPNGILVGASGVVDVGGMLTLSTLDIDDNDFLNGGNDRFRGSTSAGVTNFGTI